METYGFALKSPASLLATDRLAGGNFELIFDFEARGDHPVV